MIQPTLPGTNPRKLSQREPASLAIGESISVVIPGIKLQSLNVAFRVASRGAMFAARAKAKKQRSSASMVLRGRWPAPPCPPLVITITRIAPVPLDDDNLAGSAKHVRDGIADWLGVDDGSRLLTWRYEQRRDGRGYAVGIRIEPRQEAA